MSSPRQRAATSASGSGTSGSGPSSGTPALGASSGTSDPAFGRAVGAGSAVGSGAKLLLPSEADCVQGDEVFGDAHPGHSRWEVARRVVFPRLPDEPPEPDEDLFVGATRPTGSVPPDTRLGHTHHHLGAPPRPHREDGVVQGATDLQEMPGP